MTFKWYWTIRFKFQVPGSTNSGEQIQTIVCKLHLEEQEVTVIQEACTCYIEEECAAANSVDTPSVADAASNDGASDGAATDTTTSNGADTDSSSNTDNDNSNRDRELGENCSSYIACVLITKIEKYVAS